MFYFYFMQLIVLDYVMNLSFSLVCLNVHLVLVIFVLLIFIQLIIKMKQTVLPNKKISGEGITFLKSYEFFFESLIIDQTEMMCTQKGDASTIIVTHLL